MAIWTMDSAKMDSAAQQIQESAARMNKLVSQYTEAKAHLLSDWEGSKKDEFVQKTGTNFETLCASLIKAMQNLANSVIQSKNAHVKADNDAYHVVSGR